VFTKNICIACEELKIVFNIGKQLLIRVALNFKMKC